MAEIKKNPWVKHLTRNINNWRRKTNAPRNAILLNSVPKSGTHLVHQILHGMNYKDFEGFFASTPSWSMRQKSGASATQALSKIHNDELYTGHIFYSPMIEKKIIDLKLPNIFVYRDPRAVFVSEWYYLVTMNKYHRYHRLLKNLSADDQFELLLHGDQNKRYFFPSFSKRIEVYEGWITSTSTFKVKFEDLIDPKTNLSCLKSLLEYLSFFNGQFSPTSGTNAAEQDLVTMIQPEKSHTFTGLNPHRWRSTLSASQANQLNIETLKVRQTMGYD